MSPSSWKVVPRRRVGQNASRALAPEGRLLLHNCQVPQENLLGEMNRGCGLHWQPRRVPHYVGAASLGMAQSAYEEALCFARERVAFDRPIIEFQGIQFKLAEMATMLEASRLLVYRAAWMHDQGMHVVKGSLYCQLFATESAQRVVDRSGSDLRRTWRVAREPGGFSVQGREATTHLRGYH